MVQALDVLVLFKSILAVYYKPMVQAAKLTMLSSGSSCWFPSVSHLSLLFFFQLLCYRHASYRPLIWGSRKISVDREDLGECQRLSNHSQGDLLHSAGLPLAVGYGNASRDDWQDERTQRRTSHAAIKDKENASACFWLFESQSRLPSDVQFWLRESQGKVNITLMLTAYWQWFWRWEQRSKTKNMIQQRHWIITVIEDGNRLHLIISLIHDCRHCSILPHAVSAPTRDRRDERRPSTGRISLETSVTPSLATALGSPGVTTTTTTALWSSFLLFLSHQTVVDTISDDWLLLFCSVDSALDLVSVVLCVSLVLVRRCRVASCYRGAKERKKRKKPPINPYSPFSPFVLLASPRCHIRFLLWEENLVPAHRYWYCGIFTLVWIIIPVYSLGRERCRMNWTIPLLIRIRLSVILRKEQR